MFLADVHCSGSEDNLIECPRTVFVGIECTHTRDVGLACIRMFFDSALELYVNNNFVHVKR